MKLDYYRLILIYMVLISFSCDDPNSPSDVWNPNDAGNATPFISSISPPDSAYAGSQEITIYGGNFGDNKDSVFVYCNTGLGEIISVGPGMTSHSGAFLPTTLQVGDVVILPTMGFTRLTYKDEEYYVGPENQILGKVID